MKQSGVYFIRHIASGTLYIGSSIDIKNRCKRHVWVLKNGNHHARHLQNAWNKYGKAAFEFGILEVVNNATKDALFEREQFYFDLWKPRYNRAPIARSTLGLRLTADQLVRHKAIRSDPDTRARISEGLKRYWTPEQRARYSGENGAFAGRTHDDDALEKMSAAKKGKPSVKRVDPTKCANGLHDWIDGQKECRLCANAGSSRAYRRKRSLPPDYVRVYTPHTPEVRERISAKLTGRVIGPPSEEHRRRISEANTGKTRSAADRAKMSVAQQARFDIASRDISGDRYIEWDAARERWAVTVKVRGRKIFRRFDDKTDAVRYRDAVVRIASTTDHAAIVEALTREFPTGLTAYRNSDTGLRGVRLDERTGRWMARTLGRYLGMFATSEEAAAAVLLAREASSSPSQNPPTSTPAAGS